MRNLLIRSGIALYAISLPTLAYAQGSVSISLAQNIIGLMYPLVSTAAVFMITIAGLNMISSTDEGTLETSKKAIGMIIAGIILTQLTPTILELLLFDQIVSGTGAGGLGIFTIPSAEKFKGELLGIAEWFTALSVIVGVAMIIVSSFRVIASFGSDEAQTANKRALIQGIVGILIIGGAQVAANVIFVERQPNLIIEYIFGWVNVFLGFLLIIMVAVIIYAGVLMIANLGNESTIEKAKGIILRSIVGLILVIMSLVIVRAVLGIFVNVGGGGGIVT